MRIAFAGTPDFAVPALDALAASGHVAALAVTQPDRPAGRRRAPAPPPVKTRAEALGIPVHQTEDINSPPSLAVLREAAPDAVAVVAFGQFLSRKVLDLPPAGCVNVHASLLPELRGAAPIAWAVARGAKRTGVTTQRMVLRMDAGDVLLQEETPIAPDETAGQLHDRLAPMGARLLVRTLDGLEGGTVRPVPQDHARATFAPMLSKSDGAVDWTKPSEDVRNWIRAMTPWPSAFTFLQRGGKAPVRLTLLEAEARDDLARPGAAPGEVLAAEGGVLAVAAGTGAVALKRLQRAGGRPLAAGDFLRGFPLRPGERLHGKA